MTRALMVGATVAVIAAGCGSGTSGGSLDCAWLAGDNCWKMTADDAVSCLPPSTETGALSADKKTCTYASGVTVAFTPALVLPVPDNWQPNVTITSNGTECLHYENKDAAGIKLTVKGKTVTEGSAGGLGLTVSCPDGKSYSNANAFDLFDCGADGGTSLAGLPGHYETWTQTSINMGLLGGSQSITLFSCSVAP